MKRVYLISLIVLLGLGPFSARAALITDYEYVFEFVSEGESSTVTHDLSAYIPGVYQAQSGNLTLAFADDSYCFFNYGDCSGEEETVQISLGDLSEVIGSGDVGGAIWAPWLYDWSVYSLGGSALLDLNADGLLSVTVTATEGDFWWKKSILTVNTVSVPEPNTLLLLGAGLLAIGFVSRRRRARA